MNSPNPTFPSPRSGALRLTILICGFFSSLCAARAQVGTGWTQYSPTRTIQQVNGSDVAKYTNSGGVETFIILPGSNRCEARVNNNYTSGQRQFQGEVRVSNPTNSQAIHQKFPHVLVRGFSASGGQIRLQSATTLISGCYGKWVRLNSVHNVSTHLVDIYINGSKKATANDGDNGDGVTHYHKYGVYGTLNTSSAKSEWRSVKYFRK
jgi:hypothetical protein